MIVVDTDVLIEMFDKKSEQGRSAYQKLEQSGEDMAITAISYHELMYGLLRFGKKKIPEIEKLDVIPYTKDDALLSARLEQEYEGHGISRSDAMIAAIALNMKARIYTFNQRHYQAISQIQLF
jgi:predicted nucleic acid-binding protein